MPLEKIKFKYFTYLFELQFLYCNQVAKSIKFSGLFTTGKGSKSAEWISLWGRQGCNCHHDEKHCQNHGKRWTKRWLLTNWSNGFHWLNLCDFCSGLIPSITFQTCSWTALLPEIFIFEGWNNNIFHDFWTLPINGHCCSHHRWKQENYWENEVSHHSQSPFSTQQELKLWPDTQQGLHLSPLQEPFPVP